MPTDGSLWAALEAMDDWSTVPAAWRRRVGVHYDSLLRAKLLDDTGERSASHPCLNRPPCGCWHLRVPGSGRMVCQCDVGCDCPDFTVEARDLTVLELDIAALADSIRQALAVKRPSRQLGEPAGVWQLGTYHPEPQPSYPVYLLLPQSPETQAAALGELVTSHDRPFAVVLFTRRHLDPRTEVALRTRVHILTLEETVRLDPAGRIACLPGVRDPVRAVHERAGECLSRSDLVRAVQIASRLTPARRPKAGPTMIEYIMAVAKGWDRGRIASEYDCSKAQVSALKKQFAEEFGQNPETLVGQHGDLEDVVKSVQDPRARRIHQPTAVTGREEEFGNE